MIPPIRARCLCVSVLALSLLAGGCGGTSAKDFAKQGNAICTDAQAKARKIPRAKDLAGVAEQSRAALGILEDGIARFHKLSPPSDKKADFDSYLKLADQQVGLTRQLSAAATAKDLPKIQQLATQGQAQQAKIRPLFPRLGFTACGRTR